jgi:hypothetical protein
MGQQPNRLLAHFRIIFVFENLDAVTNRADRAHQIVTQFGAKQG